MSLRVQIQGLHDVERFQRPLEVITGLFFEEYELVFESVHDADIAVALSINGDKRVHVHGILTEKLTGNK
ncbi:coproporphyrinogen III oxidase, partial [Parageobacillus sp. SY1]